MNEDFKFFKESLGQEQQKELAEKVIKHRNDFRYFFIGRYLESLCTLFFYNIPSPFEKTRVEIALRSGYGVAYGKNKLGQDVVLGVVQSLINFNDPVESYYRGRYTAKDIKYIIPKSLRPPENYKEITFANDAKDGEFIVIYNKPINFTNDYKIIQHYADELSEIVASRYSLIIQSKIMTVLLGKKDDETMNQMISSIYNGNPFVKLAENFDVEDNVLTLDNTNLSSNLQQLKTEYQNKIAELNALFGINVLAVDKESGVSQSEANGNLGYVTANANIYLETRQQALNLYNARFNTHYEVKFDDNALGLLSVKGTGNGGKNENEQNDDNVDRNS
ncbi:MAG: hypothetical protein J6574_03895 [Gilliamella sp.]|nr:hypothetical protein [Gilliamella sp.]